MRRSILLWMCLASLISLQVRADDPPKSLDPRLKVELFAEHPQIVTPTGLDVDHRGRVFAIESNTHFPPEGYKGHPSDRVLVMSGRPSRVVADITVDIPRPRRDDVEDEPRFVELCTHVRHALHSNGASR